MKNKWKILFKSNELDYKEMIVRHPSLGRLYIRSDKEGDFTKGFYLWVGRGVDLWIFHKNKINQTDLKYMKTFKYSISRLLNDIRS